MKSTILVILFLICFSHNIYSRPVSYPGGFTLMQMNDRYFSNLHLHFSPTARYSLGLKIEHHRENRYFFSGMQYNYLLKRINEKNSQANFYFKSALGSSHTDESPYSGYQVPSGFFGFAADWEDRRFFTSYENKSFYASDISKYFFQKFRIGIAPYIGDYGDLHTWLMIQVEHLPKEDGQEINITPLFRFFKNVFLLETGFSLDKEAVLNLIIRF